MILRGFGAIIYKELLQVRRDPSTRIVFMIPIVQLIIFGFAIDMDIQHIRTVVCDLNRGIESRRLVERLANTQTFDLLGQVDNPEQVRRMIVAGKAKVGFIIPPEFASDLLKGKQALVQVLIDGSDSVVASNALQSSRSIALTQSSGGAPDAGIQFSSIDIRPRVLFNPDLLSARFYVPGLIAIILQIITTLLTAFAIVRERERGTLEQLVVTPVSKLALIIGKIVPYFFIGILESIFVLLIMRIVFGVNVEGSVFLLLSLSALFLLPALALGILISTVATNQGQAMQLGFLIILPSVLLSGFAFPRETMPFPIYLISCIVPATYYVQIVRGIILRGAGLWALWPQTLVLAGFAIVLVTLSAKRFRKRIA